MKFLNKFVAFNIMSLDSLSDYDDYSLAVSSFSTESGHGKATKSNRFQDLDDFVMNYLVSMENLFIHDVGVSTGVTSLDLYGKLCAIGKPFDLILSDKHSIFYSSGKNIVRVYNHSHKLIYGYAFSLLADPGASHWFFLGKLLYFVLALLPPPVNFREIILLDSRVKQLVDAANLSFVLYDLFGQNFITGMTFVRCMNVLNNNSWFSKEQIKIGLSNLISQLAEGGLLLIGRTDENTNQNNASLYRKLRGKLVLVANYNLGSDIIPIISAVYGP